jgi:hypothetical protein
MVIHKFAEIGLTQGVHIKSPNSIIEEWPTQLRRQASLKDAMEEFSALLGSISLALSATDPPRIAFHVGNIEKLFQTLIT